MQSPCPGKEEVRNSWANLLKGAVIYGGQEWGLGPILMGGFAFEPGQNHDPLWQEFGDTRLVLPRAMLANKDGQSFLTTNLMVGQEMEAGHDFPGILASFTSNFTVQSSGEAALSPQNPMSVEAWKRLVEGTVAEIKAGKFQKVVLAREYKVTGQQNFEVGKTLQKLGEKFFEATIFAVNRGSKTFFGATPERLVQLREGEVRTAALAGSTGRGASREEDLKLGEELVSSSKNQAEHRVVVDIIFKALEKVSENLYKGEPPRLLKLNNLQHLYTPIVGRISRQGTILELIEALHPTPALGGYPRKPALEYIQQNENLDRGWYGSPLGWLDARGEGEFVVAIRSAVVEGKEATLFAGCGIMGDSEPESEYQESCIKLKAVLSALEEGA